MLGASLPFLNDSTNDLIGFASTRSAIAPSRKLANTKVASPKGESRKVREK
ncbi:hypothetical protein [Pleurocapsa sp. PCC 7319]|uniref:hypothetical protein n=1 Tax=Pleurocapsa sp. PCC 7319 TaxID=118161 RepID=UPI00034634D3|nr:hypothetical protein [Pleurocapsa sp. PCC 7319]